MTQMGLDDGRGIRESLPVVGTRHACLLARYECLPLIV